MKVQGTAQASMFSASTIARHFYISVDQARELKAGGVVDIENQEDAEKMIEAGLAINPSEIHFENSEEDN